MGRFVADHGVPEGEAATECNRGATDEPGGRARAPGEGAVAPLGNLGQPGAFPAPLERRVSEAGRRHSKRCSAIDRRAPAERAHGRSVPAHGRKPRPLTMSKRSKRLEAKHKEGDGDDEAFLDADGCVVPEVSRREAPALLPS